MCQSVENGLVLGSRGRRVVGLASSEKSTGGVKPTTGTRWLSISQHRRQCKCRCRRWSFTPLETVVALRSSRSEFSVRVYPVFWLRSGHLTSEVLAVHQCSVTRRRGIGPGLSLQGTGRTVLSSSGSQCCRLIWSNVGV